MGQRQKAQSPPTESRRGFLKLGMATIGAPVLASAAEKPYGEERSRDQDVHPDSSSDERFYTADPGW